MMLKLGTYRVTRDVANPRPDRRSRHDWRLQETWREGMLVHVCETPMLNVTADIPETTLVLRHGRFRYQEIDLRDAKRLGGLLDALEFVEIATASQFLKYRNNAGAAGSYFLEDALDILVRRGDLTLEQLGAALDEAESEPEEE